MRAYALEVVKTLREAGFTALWAGGCVRDLLLGTDPHDYDVATDAPPAEVRKLFKRTIAVGAQFGVIEVLGPSGIHVQVATFRSDGTYSDGRHPDSVRFGSAEEDAKRRDFTINGLFYDPVAEQVIDYVGGQADLHRKIVRAIGDPRERIREDKLRMLRAIRFVARLGFSLDEETQAAIVEMHCDITQVSAERITDELKKMLSHPNRALAVDLLFSARLLPLLFREHAWPDDGPDGADFKLLRHLPAEASFPLAWSALLLDVNRLNGGKVNLLDAKYLDDLGARFRLANEERAEVAFFLWHLEKMRRADQLPWAELKPILANPRRDALLMLLAAACTGLGWPRTGFDYCQDRLRIWSAEQLNPPPLVTGEDVAELGVPKGPAYRQLLDFVRRAQLNEEVKSREEGVTLLKKSAGGLANRDSGRTDK
jgi:poly(A) polymerase